MKKVKCMKIGDMFRLCLDILGWWNIETLSLMIHSITWFVLCPTKKMCLVWLYWKGYFGFPVWSDLRCLECKNMDICMYELSHVVVWVDSRDYFD